jgi:radical SAM protein with 4Fe4S-binding SPASM domain
MLPGLALQTYNYVRHGFRRGLPSGVGIEISTACNRRCFYCPVSENPMKQQIVSEEMWSLFKRRLVEFGWRGIVGTARYNELALIPNSERYIRELSELGCKPLIHSNGDFPETVAKWCEAGAKRVVLTEHPPVKPGWRDRADALAAKYPKIIRLHKVTDENRHNHAKQVKVTTKRAKRPCSSHHGLSVDINGDTLLCCLDYFRQHKFGNIRDNSFGEIWYHPEYVKVRGLIDDRKPARSLCAGCSLL